MKKLLFLAVLLGLTGCGETDQNDTSQATLQSPETASAMQVNYRMAASPSVMSASAATFGGWNPLGLKPVGASSLLNASKTLGGMAIESHALITPAVNDVSKVLVRGAGGLALSVAVEELLGAVDWVMDPANNQIRYKEASNTIDNSPLSPLKYCGSTSSGICSTNPDKACKSDFYTDGDRVITSVKAVKEGIINISGVQGDNYSCNVIWYFKSYPNNINVSTYTLNEIKNLNYNPNLQPEEKTLPLDVVSQEIINNAESENADAQAVTLAAAQAILSEAENDAEKAKQIEDELEKNSKKCPDGRLRNYYGQCFICGSADLEQRMKIDVDIAKGAHESLGACKATHTIEGLTLRYNNYVNEAVARDKLNACYDIPHQPHLNQAKEAWRQAQEVCVKYMAAK